MSDSDFLNLEELYDVHKKQDSNRLTVYREIYSKCLAKMKHTNNILRRMECNFQVPAFVWGIPIYDYEDLRNYILYRLNENGINHAYFVDDYTLYISWKPEHIDKKKYQLAKKKSFENPAENVLSETISAGDPAVMRAMGPFISHKVDPATNKKGALVANVENPYKDKQDRPRSAIMKFDDIYEVPVNLDKIRQLSSPSRTNPSRLQPNRQLVDSWKKYFAK
jgi:hypothetical protein